MIESTAGKVQLWQAWSPPRAASVSGEPADADRLFVDETLHRGRRPPEGTAPYSLQWFLALEQARHSRHGAWVPRLLEFGKHAGETLLGLGPDLGIDWVQYARHGATVVACGPSAERLSLAQRNFELRGLTGRFLHTPQERLPLASASIDVACVSSLWFGVADPAALVSEIYRVLKPGGKVVAMAPAKYDVDFWRRIFLPWERMSQAQRLPKPAGFSARKLRQLFSMFGEKRVHKRSLRRGETPHLWRWLPLPLLERALGRILILKAFKPLSAAMTTPMAA